MRIIPITDIRIRNISHIVGCPGDEQGLHQAGRRKARIVRIEVCCFSPTSARTREEAVVDAMRNVAFQDDQCKRIPDI